MGNACSSPKGKNNNPAVGYYGMIKVKNMKNSSTKTRGNKIFREINLALDTKFYDSTRIEWNLR